MDYVERNKIMRKNAIEENEKTEKAKLKLNIEENPEKNSDRIIKELDKILKEFKKNKEDKGWKLTIEKVENGFICRWLEDEGDDEGYIEHKQVFEEKDNYSFDEEDKAELECMKEVLWFIKEHFGINHSKHNKINLEIEIKKNKDRD